MKELFNMSINYAILGMLSFKPLTGYDLKKIMQDSSFMYWSGNNNQIYKTLLELENGNLVKSEVYHQSGSPSKKVYTITDMGLAELKKWTQSIPEAFEIKNSFLIQLAWSDLLSNEELEQLLNQYEQEIEGRLFIEKKKAETSFFKHGRTSRENALWKLINENILMSYQSELEWVRKVKETLTNDADKVHKGLADTASISAKENEKMTYQIVEKNNQKYILLDSTGKPIQTEQDAMELLTICFENRIHLLLIHGERLSDDFLNLKTGIAGSVLQKFTIYSIKAAAMLDEERTKGRFKEFLIESNKGNVFRSFGNLDDAENWLLCLPLNE